MSIPICRVPPKQILILELEADCRTAMLDQIADCLLCLPNKKTAGEQAPRRHVSNKFEGRLVRRRIRILRGLLRPAA